MNAKLGKNGKRMSGSQTVNTAVMEWMEERRLMAADATLSSGVLTITGTPAGDNITLNRVNGKIKVTLNGPTKEFTNSQVNSIIANLLGGADALVTNKSI